jgi:DNA-binding transcriptional ArsR family regulator
MTVDKTVMAYSPDDMDRILRILKKEPRRSILKTLVKRDGEEHRRESGQVSEFANSQRDRIELHHNHLPKLEDENLIEVDERTGEIVPGPEFDLFKRVGEAIGMFSAEPDCDG